jgi:hypothetical protein
MTSMIDDHAVNDLTLYIDNTAMYMQRRHNIQTVLATAWVNGSFHVTGAAMLFRPLMDDAARSYLRAFPPGVDFDDPGFTPAIRQLAAETYASDFVKTIEDDCLDDLNDTAAAIIRRGKVGE